jgi:hypothetical protein
MKQDLYRTVNQFRKELIWKISTPRLTGRDNILASYPRSGITWVQFLLGNLLKSTPEEIIDFHSVHDYIPELDRHNDQIRSMSSPRIIKTHLLFRRRFKKIIYLVRDGRDVYVSYYHYRLNELPEGTTFNTFLRMKDLFPSSWEDHIKSWLRWDKPRENLLIVRYEDLLSTPFSELKRIAEFIGINVSDEVIAESIESSSFEKMRQIDQTKGRKYNLTGTKDFVRIGKAGTWRDEFSKEDIEYFKENAGDLLIRLGYENDLDW